MSTIGDETDVYNRLLTQLPQWFGTDFPVLKGLLQGYTNATVFNYDQTQYVLAQTRIQTAFGDNLDLISQDYFGDLLPRNSGETDETFRKRILSMLLLERATRPALFKALKSLTGIDPILIELWNPTDCGGYNVAQYTGYGIAGRYGSASYPYQGFADVFVRSGSGMSGFPGYEVVTMGYTASGGFARGAYGSSTLIETTISDADIYRTVLLVKAEGTIVYVRINRGPFVPPESLLLDSNNENILDNNDQPIFI